MCVCAAVAGLKTQKAAGPNGVMAEDFKAGGEIVEAWLLHILNAVMDLEAIPSILKRGVVMPVYKGGGKNPLWVSSYCGVTLTSTMTKVLECLLLARLEMVR